MFTFTFWVLAIWFIVNVIWMWFALKNQKLQKTFAWINVAAVMIGFIVYYSASPVDALSGWFLTLNWVNIVLAIIQFYFGYKKA